MEGKREELTRSVTSSENPRDRGPSPSGAEWTSGAWLSSARRRESWVSPANERNPLILVAIHLSWAL